MLFSFITILTGFIGLTLMTRLLSPFEYGEWNFINGLFIYSLSMIPIVSYWLKREIARDSESARTGIFFSGILSIVGASIYLLVSFVFDTATDSNFETLIFASILIPMLFIFEIFRAISIGRKPEFATYANVMVSSFLMIFIIFFVYFFQFGIFGVIFASFFAYLITIIILTIYFRDILKHEIQTLFVKKWIKLSWVPLYPVAISIIHRSDVIIFTLFTATVVGLAYWTVALSLTILIQHSSRISQAAYPKLLQNKDSSFLKNNITHLLFFAIPATALTITFAREGLFALNPIYESIYYVVILLSLQIFFRIISGVFENFIIGNETVDLNNNVKTKDYLKSKLFLVPTIRLGRNSIFLIIFTIGLYFQTLNEFELIDLLYFWASLGLIIQIPYTIILFGLVKKYLSIKFDFSAIVKYVLTSLFVFIFIHFLIDEFVVYTESLFDFIPQLIPLPLLGLGLYAIILYFTDSSSKKLITSVINEFKNYIK